MNDPLGLFDEEGQGSDPLGLFSEDTNKYANFVNNSPEAVKGALGGLEGMGAMLASTPAFIEGFGRKVYSQATAPDTMSEEEKRAQAEQAAKNTFFPQVHPVSERGKQVEELLGIPFQKAIEGGGKAMEAFTAGQTFANDPSLQNPEQVAAKYGNQGLEAAKTFGQLGVEGAMVKGGIDQLHGIKEAVQGDIAHKGMLKEEPTTKVEPTIKEDPLGLFNEETAKQAELFPEDTSNNPYLRQPTTLDENGMPINRTLSQDVQDTARMGDLFSADADAIRAMVAKDMEAKKQAEIDQAYEQRDVQQKQLFAEEQARQQVLNEPDTYSPTQGNMGFEKTVRTSIDRDLAQGEVPKVTRGAEVKNEVIQKLSENDGRGALESIAKLAEDKEVNSTGNALGVLAKRMLENENIARDIKTKVLDTIDTIRGYFSNTTGELGVQGGKAGVGLVTVMHEFVHSAVNEALNFWDKKMYDKLSMTQRAGAKALNDLLADLKSEKNFPTLEKALGMDRLGDGTPVSRAALMLDNTRELVAYATTDPALQAALKQIKVPGGTLMSKLRQGMAKVLGLDPKEYTALDKVLDASDKLISESTGQWTSSAKGKERSFSQGEKPDIHVNGDATEAIKKIPGLKGLIADLRPFEEMKPEWLKEADISDNAFRDNLVSGGRMTAALTKNSLVNWVVENTYQAVRRAEVKSAEQLSKVGTGLVSRLKALDNASLSDMWAKLQAIEGKNEGIDLTPRQKMAYEAWDKIRNDIYSGINEVLAAKGMSPITKRPNYLAGSFTGDFRSIARNANGDPIGFVGGKTRGEALKAVEALKKEVPDAIFDPVEHNPLYKRAQFQKEVGAEFTGFQEMLEMLSSTDPLAQKLAASQDGYYSKQAFDFLNFKQRFKQKKGIYGSEGNKIWKDAYTNAKEGWDAQTKWVEYANRWIEQQKVGQEVSRVFSDPEIGKAQKNAVAYSQEYYQNAFGRRENLGKIVDTTVDAIAKATGIGGSVITGLIRELRRFTLANTLGFSGAFMASQLAQVWQVMPTSFVFLRGRGLISDGLSSSILGASDATHMFLYANLGKQHFLDNVSKPGQQLAKYALENHIIDPHILEGTTLKPKGILGKTYQQYMKVAGKTISMPDQLTRAHYFMSIGHYAMDAGMPFKEAASLADKMTSIAMADYTRQERAMIYQKMGLIGEFAGTVKTYVHNQYSQVGLYAKESNKAALATALGVQMTMGGLMGFYGMDELDALFKWIKGAMGFELPSPKEGVLQNTPDAVAYGPVSAITGMDFSSKFSAANVLPGNPAEAVFPLISQWVNFGTAAGHAMKYPTTRNALKPLWEISPTPIKAAIEQGAFTTDQGMTLSPRTDEGKYARNTSDLMKRFAGSRSLGERRDADQAFAVGSNMQARQQKLDSMEKAIGQYLDANDEAAANDLANKYVELGGDPKQLNKRLITRAGNQTRSSFEQRKKAPRTLKDLMNQQEVLKYGQ